MLIKKISLRAAGVSLAATVLLSAHPLRAQSSDNARIEKLEHAVELLQKQNTELKAEVSSLKQHPAPHVTAEGPTKTEINYDGKTYVEKTVPLEKSSADKWKLSTSVTEMELYGDARFRYDYRGGETKDRGPVGAPGAGVAGTNDWLERARPRYRLRLGLRGTLLDDWFFGLRLETSQSVRSTNVTFGDDTSGSSTASNNGPFSKVSDGISVGQAYVGYRGFRDLVIMGGRMPLDNVLVGTRMVWDDDINPEGVSEQWKHTFVFGGEASDSYSKDGKATAALTAKPEPF